MKWSIKIDYNFLYKHPCIECNSLAGVYKYIYKIFITKYDIYNYILLIEN
jgi:hypothetical protein